MQGLSLPSIHSITRMCIRPTLSMPSSSYTHVTALTSYYGLHNMAVISGPLVGSSTGDVQPAVHTSHNMQYAATAYVSLTSTPQHRRAHGYTPCHTCASPMHATGTTGSTAAVQLLYDSCSTLVACTHAYTQYTRRVYACLHTSDGAHALAEQHM